MKYRVITYGHRWAVVDISDKAYPEILWLFDAEEWAHEWVAKQEEMV